MNCPTCGAAIAAEERFATLVICAYCESAVVLDEKVARLGGKMSALAQPHGPLYTGGSGKVEAQRFRVLGRVRYGYANGFWDEWYLLFEDQTVGWISEDERNFTLEAQVDLANQQLDFERVRPGDQVTIDGRRYHVDERDTAECEGGEGQLPFIVTQGQRVPFLDCSASGQFATVEFDDHGPRVFIGRRISANDIAMDVPAPRGGAADTLSAERAGDDKRRERIVRSGKRVAAVKCWSCAASLSVPDAPATSVTCESCGNNVAIAPYHADCPGCGGHVPIFGGKEAQHATCPQCEQQVDVSGAEPSLLAALVPSDRPKVPLRIGQPFNFRGTEYRVTGHLRFAQREGGELYISDEFLLFAPDVGYRYLILENGHFSFCRELDERPQMLNARSASKRQKFHFLGKQWVVFERCDRQFVIQWVEGELPWVAKTGDVSSYLDCIAPPFLLSAEWTDTEMEFYEAEYLGPGEAAAALGLSSSAMPRRSGVAANQPFGSGRFGQQAALIMAVFAGLAFVLATTSCARQGAQIAEFSISPTDYAEEYLTSEFTTTRGDTLYACDFSSNLSQAWLYLDVAVVNAQDEAVLDFSAEMSYYSGADDEGSWTESATDDSKVFKLEEPGTYRLLLLGQAGRWSESAGESTDTSAGAPLNVRIREGVAYSGYYLGLGWLSAAAAAILIIVPLVRRSRFETTRWDE